ncbi:MAG: hypothetical protein E7657_03785 [Ruminococcaceae bacterium]|nr:hypothetical protein [Oscillospiraceae bacterium]
MRQKLISLGLYVLVFAFALFLSFLYLSVFINLFSKFNLLDSKVGLFISVIGSVLVSIVVLVYVIVRVNSFKKTKFSNWISMNYPKMILYYVFSVICFASIKSKIIWKYEDLKSILSTEWTIIGISITIFVVWPIVLEHLKKKKPQQPSDPFPLSKRRYIEEKGEFYQNTCQSFNFIPLLTANIIVISVASSCVYFSSSEVNLLNQTVVTIAFYLCTNTLIELFMSALLPIKEERNAILDGTKNSSQEIEEYNQIDETTNQLFVTLDRIKASTTFTEEEKAEIAEKLLLEYCGIQQNAHQSTNSTDIETKKPSAPCEVTQ